MTGDVSQVSVMPFRLGDDWFFVDIMRVREVVRPLDLRSTDGMPACVAGSLLLRGAAVPVLNLRERLALPQSAVPPRPRVLVLTLPGHLIGILVDEAAGVITLAVDEIRPPSSQMTDTNGSFHIGTVCVGERLFTLLDIDRLLSPEERQSLAAVRPEQYHGQSALFVGCPFCRKKFRIDSSRIRQEVMTVRCSSCRSLFRITRPVALADHT